MTGHWIGIAEEAVIADLTAKLAESQAREAKLREALDRLARLGNGPHYGNSVGNDIAKEALAQLDKKCEAGVSLQGLWDCWDAVHGGQEPVARVYRYGSNSNGEPWHGIHWFNTAIDAPDGTLLYLHPAPIPEGWQLVPTEATKDMSDNFWSAYIPAPDGMAQSCSFEDFHDFCYMYKAMLAAAPKYEE